MTLEQAAQVIELLSDLREILSFTVGILAAFLLSHAMVRIWFG